MKTLINQVAVIILSAASMTSSTAFCQIMHFASAKTTTPEITKQKEDAMLSPGKDHLYLNWISIRAKRTFIRQFKNTDNVSWRTTNDGGYVAEFNKDSAEIIVRYKANGSWNYTVTRYAENKMLPALRKLVKDTYSDYKIMQVAEISLPNEENIIYRVVITTKDNFKVLRICDGEMEAIEEYTTP